MMLSQETLTGLKITGILCTCRNDHNIKYYNVYLTVVSSFVELVPELFKISELNYSYDRINQDPLEKHFGRLRQQGRTIRTSCRYTEKHTNITSGYSLVR